MLGRFLVTQNPEADSKLPYLINIPLGNEGLILKARSAWPRTAKVFCHRYEGPWPSNAETVDEAGVLMCERRGVAVDLVLDRGRDNRSQLVFTRLADGREAIFWQTPKTTRGARPGMRIPGRRASSLTDFVISIDTRERYALSFAGKQCTTEKRGLPVGDYGAFWNSELVATVERKSLPDLVKSVSDATFAYQLASLASMPMAAVVIDDRWSAVFKLPEGRGGWLADQLSKLQVRYPSVPIVFTETRPLAAEWVFRWLGAAVAARLDTPDDPTAPRQGRD